MSPHLSPLNFAGLIAAQRAPEELPAARARERKEPPIEIVEWQCSVCYERHDLEEDARDCCATEEGGDSKDCPVCMSRYQDARDASDCCLWKDFDAPTRWRMADAVDAGSTWADELRGYTLRKA